MRKMTGWLIRTAALCLVCATALAQEPGSCLAQTGPRLVQGGIGETSLQALRAQERAYSLKLVFTLTGGQYVAGVDVTIEGAGLGAGLRQRSGGPWLLACLPAGTYTVTAEYEALRQSRKVVIGKGLRTEYFRWPAGPGDGVLLPEPGPR